MKHDNITCIVTMYNQKQQLEVCLEWLNSIVNVNKIILVDNGSDDGTSTIIKTMGYDYIIFDEGKQGYGRIWNAAIDNFQLDEVVVFMDMQYIPGKKCLIELAKAALEKKNGVVAPRINEALGEQFVFMNSIGDMFEIENKELEREENNFCAKVVGCNGGIWAISREKLRKNGRFHEQLVQSDNVLLDYELGMMQQGYSAVVCKKAIAFKLDLDRGEAPLIENQSDKKLLKERWNMNYFNMVPSKNLIDFIEEDKEAEFHVLEIGCDLGATLLSIKNKYHNCKVYGMEINSAAVNIAKNIIDVREGNIEEEKLLFEEKFDYIIFGDVLEHLHNPQKVIRFCKILLKKQGCIIASIPNLMHISVMQQLLNGRFEYQNTGLLDSTHIHFFTYYEILLMFQKEGYSIEEISMTKVNITKEQEILKMKLMEISENVEMHMYDAYQYLVKARCE